MANIKENKRYHFTYKTTNLINNRYYLGMHSTNRIDDGYLGSGKRLYYELSKYGRDNFKFEILEQFDSREQLVQAEINLITEQDLKNPNCLNLKQGGNGGLISKEHIKKLRQGASKYQKEKWQDPEYRERMILAPKKAISLRHKLGEVKYDNFKGKKHTEETKKKMSQSSKGRGTGINNSQYGTCWITDGTANKKIRRGDNIPKGWNLGRKVK